MKVRLNKIDAARRLLDAAIRMAFTEEDPVAIQALVAGASRIIRDICEQRGDIESYRDVTARIAPGHEREFWKAWNASANFLKHAERDADGIHELDDEAAEFLMVVTTLWYSDLGNSPSPEMRVFGSWWMLTHPKMLKGDVLTFPGLDAPSSQAAFSSMTKMPRKDQLKAAMLALREAKGNP